MRVAPLFLALVAAAAVRAQPAPETVDADLLYGFLSIEDPSDLVIGGRPDAVLEALVPDDAVILATLTRTLPLGDGERQTVLARVDATPREAAAVYRERAHVGWWVPDAYEPPQHGFVSNAYEERISTQLTLCPEDESSQIAGVEFDARPDGGSYLTVSRLDIRFGGRCSLENRPQDESSRLGSSIPDIQTKLPALRALPEARLDPNGGGGSDDYWVQSARLYGNASLETVAAHFTDEMERAGWTERAETSTDGLSTSVWTMTDDDGLLTATLTVTPHDSDSFDLRLALLVP